MRIRMLNAKPHNWKYGVKLQRKVWWGWTTHHWYKSDYSLADCIRSAEAAMPEISRGKVLFDSKYPSN